ncbi:restriction endonuclease subunit S [Enterococcus faecalis]|uniref:restriction endonuclease subunit S n=4 Tax=Enterococcus TaxID=1350 RepID=UPI0019FFB286|nr:restriction endonuclease subunit S [Enterococcus faecalis]EGO6557644.1 restriction endonuclease subunit S [Enterococcus faecalis]EGO6719442.1 restriction endonuclease subunit S [Enterococcus faecalis]EGO7472521.1 restriction endonuclease subunit S [Enterococcus faecalis]EGO8880477.1 restriction endonuclease subunit S [Enterococcus faecalis]EGO8974291.1 restriction endonuclease subunit S [Enterococcus faecalis]
MRDEMKKVPRLRFRGFSEDWELCKFKGLLDEQDGIRRGPFGSALKKAFFVENSEYVVYEQQNAIYDTYETRYKISKEKFKELEKFSISEGDFIMSGAGTIGRISRVPKGVAKGVFNQALIRFRTNTEVTDSEYFIQFVRADKMQKKLTGANPGSAITNLVPMSEIKKWDILIPSKKEQILVGLFLKKLDNTITLHQRKLDQLKELKKAYLQLMFPKKDETVPRVRFADFEDDWQLCKLGDVVEIFDGTHQTPRYTDSGVKFVSVENIATLETKKYITHEAYEKEYSKKRAKKGDILMTRIGDIGTMKVIETDEPLAYYVTLALLKAKETNPYFLSFIISSPEIQRNIWKRTLHIAFPKKINLGEINQVEMKITIFEEQDKIGDLFTNLDDAIILNQNKLNQLKSLKKSYLQNMFI